MKSRLERATSEAVDIGTLTWLAMQSSQHNRMATGDFLDELLKIATDSNKVHIFRAGDEPVAWLAWEWISHTQLVDRVVSARAQGHHIVGELPANAMTKHVWWRYWVRPYGCHQRLAQHIQTAAASWWPMAKTTHWFDPHSSDGRGRLCLGVKFDDLSLIGQETA